MQRRLIATKNSNFIFEGVNHPDAFVEGNYQESIVEASVNGVTLRFTKHARQRCCQRAIPLWAVLLTLETDPVFDHGDLVYCLTDRFLLKRNLKRLVERLRGLTVVVRRDGVIKTVKWDFQRRQKGCWQRRNQFNWNSISRRYTHRRRI